MGAVVAVGVGVAVAVRVAVDMRVGVAVDVAVRVGVLVGGVLVGVGVIVQAPGVTSLLEQSHTRLSFSKQMLSPLHELFSITPLLNSQAFAPLQDPAPTLSLLSWQASVP